jgi:adenylate cyclase
LQRRLTAIMFADIVNYSHLMSEDQSSTLSNLRHFRSTLFDPTVADHRGNIIKSMGDGWLVEFASISDAVECAISVQMNLAARDLFHLRIGIHIGEVVFEENDVFGDGVNIAARLEAVAHPGEVVISDTAHQSLDAKTALQFTGGETHELKNIAREIQVWRWKQGGVAARPEPFGNDPASVTIFDKPSIAVLPFENMSGDPEQEYFADGISEDIITALSKFEWLPVIARNSSFSFKGQALDIREIGRSLSVRYILEGSVRRVDDKVRITGQLIDASDGTHIWADKFDGVLNDIFALQDKITLDVVGAIEPSLRQAEINRLRAKPTEDLLAYELYLRGQSHFHKVTDEDNQKAIRFLSKAVTMDPGYAIASALLAWCYVQRKVQDWEIEDTDVQRAIVLAAEVLESDRADAMALAFAAHVTSEISHDYVRAQEAFERSLQENPNSALANALSAANLTDLNEHELALRRADYAMRLSPKDTFRYVSSATKAVALLGMKRYDEAIIAAKAAVNDRRNFLMSHYLLIAALVLADDLDNAQNAKSVLFKLNPNVSVRSICSAFPYFDSDHAKIIRQAWHKVGIPE